MKKRLEGIVVGVLLGWSAAYWFATWPTLRDDNDFSQVLRVVSPSEPAGGEVCGLVGGESKRRLSIAAVGDILLHDPIVEQSKREGSYRGAWEEVEDILHLADVRYFNFEGSIIGNKLDKPPGRKFWYERRIAQDIVDSGFDVASTANTHCLDAGLSGLIQTVKTLQAAGIQVTGTSTSPFLSGVSAATIVERKGWRVAFLACTARVNGVSKLAAQGDDSLRHVLWCFDLPKKTRSSSVQGELDKLVKQQRDGKIDAIIVLAHVGTQFTSGPSQEIREWAYSMLERGAAAMLISHPHVPQALESHMTSDGRKTLVAWSLSNFVSACGWNISPLYQFNHTTNLQCRTGMVVTFQLEKDQKGRPVVPCAAYIPTCTYQHSSWNASRQEALRRFVTHATGRVAFCTAEQAFMLDRMGSGNITDAACLHPDTIARAKRQKQIFCL